MWTLSACCGKKIATAATPCERTLKSRRGGCGCGEGQRGGTGGTEQLRMAVVAAIDQELSQFSALLMQSPLNRSWVWKLWMRQSSPETHLRMLLILCGGSILYWQNYSEKCNNLGWKKEVMNFATLAVFCEMILFVGAEFLDKYSLLLETWELNWCDRDC